MTEREERQKASRMFWEELSKTRQKDPFNPSGEDESLRSWARRLGVDVNNLINWERGSAVTPKLLRRICDRLGLPDSEFYRLFAISDPDAPPHIPAQQVDLYNLEDTSLDRIGRLSGTIAGKICLSPEVIKDVNASYTIVAFRVPMDDDEMSPPIAPGSYVFVDVKDGKSRSTFESGAVYAISNEGGGSSSVRMLEEKNGVLWICPTNSQYPREKAWTGDLQNFIIGKVFLVQAPLRRVA